MVHVITTNSTSTVNARRPAAPSLVMSTLHAVSSAMIAVASNAMRRWIRTIPIAATSRFAARMSVAPQVNAMTKTIAAEATASLTSIVVPPRTGKARSTANEPSARCGAVSPVDVSTANRTAPIVVPAITERSAMIRLSSAMTAKPTVPSAPSAVVGIDSRASFHARVANALNMSLPPSASPPRVQ